jgi:drug/metabolite transporter (DMT)-like permease
MSSLSPPPVDSLPPSNSSRFPVFSSSFLSHPSPWFVYFMLLLTQLSWSGFHVYSSYTMRHIDSFVLPAFRSLFSVPLLYLICLQTVGASKIRLLPSDYRESIIASLYGGSIGPQLFNLGIRLSTAIDGGVSQPMIPIFTAIICLYHGTEKFDKLKMLGIFIAVSGSFFIVICEALTSEQQDDQARVTTESRLAGWLCFLLQTFLFSHYVIIQRRIVQRSAVPSLVFTMFVFLIGGIPNVLIGFIAAFFVDWPSVPLAAWGGVLYLVLFGTVFAFACFAWASKHLPPSGAAMIIALAPFFTALIDSISLGEILTTTDIIGGLTIFTGLIIVIQAKSLEEKRVKKSAKQAMEIAANEGFKQTQLEMAEQNEIQNEIALEMRKNCDPAEDKMESLKTKQNVNKSISPAMNSSLLPISQSNCSLDSFNPDVDVIPVII